MAEQKGAVGTPKSEIEPMRVRPLFTPPPVVLATVKDNIISIGLFHTFSFKPLLIGIGVMEKRHSHSLLQEAGDFGINFPTREMYNKVELCGTTSGRDVDKFAEHGLTLMEPKEISSKLIAECPLNLECRVVDEYLPENGTHTWFIGEVVAAHMAEGHRPEDCLLYWDKKYRLPGEIVYKRGE